MLGIHDYWLFVLTGALLNLTPGQDTLYILGRSVGQGARIGVASALGIGAGSLVHTALAAVGPSAILATSANAFMAVKYLGALYLICLGIRMFAAASSTDRRDAGQNNATFRTAFREGVVTNVLNPKVALFFLALMPQFIDPVSQTKIFAFVALGLTFVTTGTIWGLTLAALAGKLRSYFVRQPKRLDLISKAAGAVFVLLGLKLAISRQ